MVMNLFNEQVCVGKDKKSYNVLLSIFNYKIKGSKFIASKD